MRTVPDIQREIDALEQEQVNLMARLSALHSYLADAMHDEVEQDKRSVEGYLYFLDGDEWTPSTLEEIADQLRKNPTVISATVNQIGLYVKQKVDAETWQKLNVGALRSAGLAPDGEQ